MVRDGTGILIIIPVENHYFLSCKQSNHYFKLARTKQTARYRPAAMRKSKAQAQYQPTVHPEPMPTQIDEPSSESCPEVQDVTNEPTIGPLEERGKNQERNPTKSKQNDKPEAKPKPAEEPLFEFTPLAELDSQGHLIKQVRNEVRGVADSQNSLFVGNPRRRGR